MSYLTQVDPLIARLVKAEEKRQSETLMMIASENYASAAVEEAVGSALGNKYAEGYSGRRYYQGNAVADQVEQLCIDRAKKLFKVPFVNVQPHSGSPANFAVQHALLKPRDVYMGLSLASGGHLTHGARLTSGATYFRSVQYEVKPNGYIDYVALEKLAKKHKPKLIIAGTTAYPRLLDWERFAFIAKKVDAWLQTDIAHIAGLIVGGAYPSPVPYVDIITTTTHKTLRGPRGAMIMVTAKGLTRDPDLGKRINTAIIPGIQGGPHLNSIAGIAVALQEASTPKYKSYTKQIVKNAKVLAAALTTNKVKLVTGGTDSHLLVADMRAFGLLGNTMAEACEAVGMVLNRNGVPFDPNPPFYPSGIRLGTPGMTTRGMKEKEMKLVAACLAQVAKSTGVTAKALKLDTAAQRKPEARAAIIKNTKELTRIKAVVLKVCKRFPIPKKYV